MAVVSIISVHFDRKIFHPFSRHKGFRQSFIPDRTEVFSVHCNFVRFLPAEYQDTFGLSLRSPPLYHIEQTIIGMMSILTVSNLFCVGSKLQEFLFRLIPEQSYQ